jgi:hypothetical protein
MRRAVTKDGEKYTMKNFPNRIRVIKPEGRDCRNMLKTWDRQEM